MGNLVFTPAAAPPSTSITINIVDRSHNEVAPETLLFGVTLTGFDTAGPGVGEVWDARYHDIYYYWDFGEGAYTPYTYGSHLTKPDDKTSRYAKGPFAAHTYRQAGTYSVRCTVHEPSSGKTATVLKTDVVVGDPDTLFSANDQTWVIDTTGTGLAAYPNATIKTSLSGAIADLKSANNENKPVRFILRRDQTHTLSETTIGDDDWPTVHFLAADEAGDKPLIDGTSVTTNTSMLRWWQKDSTTPKDWVVQDLEFYGNWDTENETGTFFVNGIELLCLDRTAPVQTLIDQCIFRDLGGQMVKNVGNDEVNFPMQIHLNDCKLGPWGNFGIYYDSCVNSSISGCAVDQNPLANHGGPKDGTFNNHGPLRGSKPGPLSLMAVQSSQFFSVNGWGEPGGTGFSSEGIISAQPCWRWDTFGSGGSFYSLSNCVLEGGDRVIASGTQSDAGSDSKRINALIQYNYLLGSTKTVDIVTIARPGFTIRNNVMVFPEPTAVNFLTWRPNAFIAIDDTDAASGEFGEPIRTYNNTMLNFSAIPVDEIEEFGNFTDGLNANNVFYQSLATPTDTADGPLDSTAYFTPSYLGYKHNSSYPDVTVDGITYTDFDTLQTQYATPAANVWTGTPEAGSAAIGDAAGGLIAYDDFTGMARGVSPSRGAREEI